MAENGLRSDGGSCGAGFLGDFVREPALFSVYEIPRDQSCYPNEPGYFLVDVDDNRGTRACCTIHIVPGEYGLVVSWRDAWLRDQRAPWILSQAFTLIDKATNKLRPPAAAEGRQRPPHCAAPTGSANRRRIARPAYRSARAGQPAPGRPRSLQRAGRLGWKPTGPN